MLRTAHKCVRIIAQNCHTQHRAVLIIFPLILQTSINSSDTVYWREGVYTAVFFVNSNDDVSVDTQLPTPVNHKFHDFGISCM